MYVFKFASFPPRTTRDAGFISIVIVTVLFLTVNVAYISAVPLDEIKGSGQLVGGLFFEHVFGGQWASKILPVLVAFGCVGNAIAVMGTIGQPDDLRHANISVIGKEIRFLRTFSPTSVMSPLGGTSRSGSRQAS
ncbi:hypothetical protein BJY52DRAFT_1258785 [Lactarius psammicola]|nr:hypothetical protein BJY52DRAFT_1258785 [Lactarius psammicola]